MPADTYTSRLGLIKQGTGNNNNSWGTTFNASFADVIDRAIAGEVVHADTGGTLDLSGSPPPAGPSLAIDLMQAFNGTLTSNLNVVMPTLSKTWFIGNFTGGAFSLLVSTGLNTIEIPQGVGKWVTCFITGLLIRQDDDEIGQIGHFANSSVPAGWMACNGASLVRADHPNLFAKIGTTWGSVDGTHFTVPNFTDTGRFLRSSSGTLSVGTYQSNQNLAHTHTISGAPAVGTLTTDNPGNHTHSNSLTDPGHSHGTNAERLVGGSGIATGSGGQNAAAAINSATTGITITNAAAGSHTHNVTGTLTAGTLATASQGGTEARPESAVVLMCIRY